MNRRALVLLVVLAAVPLRADDAAQDPRALVERAIAFHGGNDALAHWPGLEMRGQVELTGRAAGRSADVLVRERGDGAFRRETTFEFRGSKITSTEIYDGQTFKRRFRSGWDDLPLDEPRQEAAHRIPFLLEALARGPKAAGSGTEGDTAVWYVEVPDGRGAAKIGLARDDGRVVSIEYPGTKAEGMGTKEDVIVKLVLRDPRPVGNVRIPFDQELFADGSPDGRLRLEEVTSIEAFDATWLEVPDQRDRFVPSEELAY